MFKPSKQNRQLRRKDKAQGHQFIRATGEWRSYVVMSLIVLIVSLIMHMIFTEYRSIVDDLPLLLILPVAILAFGCYKAFFPSEWVYDDEGNPGQWASPFPDVNVASDTPSRELKGTLGPMADELHELEKRLLDSMASAHVAGPGLIVATKELSSTRSDLIGGADAAPAGECRKTGKPRGPREPRQ